MLYLFTKMRTSCILMAMLLFSSLMRAQAPMQFNFQAAARYPNGAVMSDLNIRIRLTIRDETKEGNAEYSEIRSVRTDQLGMFNIAIGNSGALSTSGSLRDVQWKKGVKYLQVEVDPKGGNQFTDLGTRQLLSVPYALFSLESGNGSRTGPSLASNGISYSDTCLQIGNNEGDTSAALMNNRDIPLHGHSLRLKDGAGEIGLSKGLITLQPDSTNTDDVTSGGPVMIINPVNARPDAVPFMYSRSSTKQHNGLTSPNEVVLWGHNIGSGGGPAIAGLPGIGYSLESNYRPDPDTRFVESHEFYLTPRGNQVRLKSYTINTSDDHVDFYHSVDNFSLRKPLSNQDYFYVSGNGESAVTHWQTNNSTFSIRVSDDHTVLLDNGSGPDANLLFSNWGSVLLPGIILSGGVNRLNAATIPEKDYAYSMGDFAHRWSDVCSYKFAGEKMILKPGWAAFDNIVPTATLDIAGQEGYSQLRMRTSYTPTSSSDPAGEVGTTAWDEHYIYIKTASGWKRSNLTSF